MTPDNTLRRQASYCRYRLPPATKVGDRAIILVDALDDRVVTLVDCNWTVSPPTLAFAGMPLLRVQHQLRPTQPSRRLKYL